jgi:hypothetical protein
MKVVIGNVYGEGDYNGLPGASVTEVGTANGTTTSNSGSFTLVVSSPISMIRISHLGYKDQVISAGSFNSFVTLEPTDIDLEEVEIRNEKKPNYLLIVGGTALAVLALTQLFGKKPKKVTVNG